MDSLSACRALNHSDNLPLTLYGYIAIASNRVDVWHVICKRFEFTQREDGEGQGLSGLGDLHCKHLHNFR